MKMKIILLFLTLLVTAISCQDKSYKTITVISNVQTSNKGRHYKKKWIVKDQFKPYGEPFITDSEISCAIRCSKEISNICASFTVKGNKNQMDCQFGFFIQNQIKAWSSDMGRNVFIEESGKKELMLFDS